jgi:hypothetical protein
MVKVRELTWEQIEAEFGPLTEIGLLPDGNWDIAALDDARRRRLLWTRVDPGLVSTGLHYVNRECHYRAMRPHPADVEVCEVDPDLSECEGCGDFIWNGDSSLCDECRA